jgi:hypothetical protein
MSERNQRRVVAYRPEMEGRVSYCVVLLGIRHNGNPNPGPGANAANETALILSTEGAHGQRCTSLRRKKHDECGGKGSTSY